MLLTTACNWCSIAGRQGASKRVCMQLAAAPHWRAGVDYHAVAIASAVKEMSDTISAMHPAVPCIAEPS